MEEKTIIEAMKKALLKPERNSKQIITNDSYELYWSKLENNQKLNK